MARGLQYSSFVRHHRSWNRLLIGNLLAIHGLFLSMRFETIKFALGDVVRPRGRSLICFHAIPIDSGQYQCWFFAWPLRYPPIQPTEQSSKYESIELPSDLQGKQRHCIYRRGVNENAGQYGEKMTYVYWIPRRMIQSTICWDTKRATPAVNVQTKIDFARQDRVPWEGKQSIPDCKEY